MLSGKFRCFLVIAFMSIFALKLAISAAPMLFDPESVKHTAFHAEPDQEPGSEEDMKGLLKFTDYKAADSAQQYFLIPVLCDCGMKNCCIDHSKRYVNPYHTSVPTPPPNRPLPA